MTAYLDMMAGPLSVADWISWACIVCGAFFALTGALGIYRLPDVFTRMHGAGMIDTMGISMILIGLMFQADEAMVVIKLALVLVFIFFTSPTTTFALARAAIHGGTDPAPYAKPKGNGKDKAKTKAKADAKAGKKKKNKKEAKSSQT